MLPIKYLSHFPSISPKVLPLNTLCVAGWNRSIVRTPRPEYLRCRRQTQRSCFRVHRWHNSFSCWIGFGVFWGESSQLFHRISVLVSVSPCFFWGCRMHLMSSSWWSLQFAQSTPWMLSVSPTGWTQTKGNTQWNRTPQDHTETSSWSLGVSVFQFPRSPRINRNQGRQNTWNGFLWYPHSCICRRWFLCERLALPLRLFHWSDFPLFPHFFIPAQRMIRSFRGQFLDPPWSKCESCSLPRRRQHRRRCRKSSQYYRHPNQNRRDDRTRGASWK